MGPVGLLPTHVEVSVPATSFVSKRINDSTFLIIEVDRFEEQPHVYVKIYEKYLVITDTGCNSPRSKTPAVVSLRQYLETFPLSTSDNQPLNPQGKKAYIVICSHCHYDHILGLPQFLSAKPTIIASALGKSFIQNDLPTHSLCKYLGVPTPQYEVSHWAQDQEYFSLLGNPFRIQFFHTPGHTPDSLAWYDIDEHHLYVGDTFYERRRSRPISGVPDGSHKSREDQEIQGAIIFPAEGNWIHYISSLNLLHSFVLHTNEELKRQHRLNDGEAPRVKVGCGHLTYDADAVHMIVEVKKLFQAIIVGEIPVRRSTQKRGTVFDFWLEHDDAKYSVEAPRRLAEEARKHFAE